MSFRSEFKEFISQGNVVDLAVGVVIGAAFAKIVDSLVTDVLMPPIGMLIGGVNFEDLKIVLKEATVDAAGKVTEPMVAIGYGMFLQNCIHFTIIALSIFLFIVKPMNKMRPKKEEKKEA
jgi:large conductance mechanosensitive channel